MIELRPYQQDALTALGEGYRRGLRRMVVSHPTGTGKTVLFSNVAKGAVAKERRVLVLAHRDELLNQARDKMLQVAPELEGQIGLVKGKTNDYHERVTIASVQSLHAKRLERIVGELSVAYEDPWDIVVVDECHHSAADSYQRVLEQAGCLMDHTKIMTLGVTATPQRADAKDLGETWEEIVHHMDILDAMRAGYLCDLRGIAVRLEALDLSGVRVSRGDYAAGETGERLMEAEAPRHVYGAWSVHAPDRKTIIFTPTIDVARSMAAVFTANGVSAVHLSGETPLDDRRQILKDFADGTIQVIANAQVLTEGFDEPTVDCIVIARPTRSQVMYSQMIGRGTRIFPGKEDCLVLDMVGATNRLDLQTLPKLFGMGDPSDSETAPQQTVLELDAERRERQIREGKIVAEQVDLFDRQKIHWKMDRPGRWVLGGVKGEGLLLAVQPDNTWTAYRFYESEGYYRPATHAQVLGERLDLGYGMGVVEEYVRKNGAAVLVDKEAGWRSGTASPGQLDYLLKLGVNPGLEPLTKGEASDMIDLARVRKMERRARVTA